MQDNEKVTLQEIANVAKVSVGTVYKAINNKKGVGENKKAQIIKIAESMNYMNKKKINNECNCNIAVLLPEPVNTDKYYYQFLWKGIRKRTNELSLANLSIIEYTYNGSIEDQKFKMEEILNDHSINIKGLITNIWDETKFLDILDRFHEKGIEIFLLESDAPSSERKSIVMTDPNTIGRLAAEYLGSMIKESGRVILMGTRRDSFNHSQIVNGFFSQMSITNPKLQVIEIYESIKYPEKLYGTIKDLLTTFDDIKGIYSNNARTTAGVYNYIGSSIKDRDIILVGSDIFSISLEAMHKGYFNAIISQKPEIHGYKIISVVFEHFIMKKEVKEHYNILPSLYLKNNVPDFESLNI